MRVSSRTTPGRPISGADEKLAQFYDENWGLNRYLGMDELEKDFQEKMIIWKESDCKKAFLDMIDSNKPPGGWRFNKVVSLGTSTFIREDPEFAGNSMFQFVCVVDVAKELEKRGHAAESGVQVFTQDPKYFEQDFELMTSKGVTVLPTTPGEMIQDGLGMALVHLSAHTLLFAWRVEMGPQMCLDLGEPVIGMQVGGCPEFLREVVEQWGITSVGAKYERDHMSRAFPKFEEHEGAFTHLEVYWRKTRGPKEEGQ